jgi:hypothetical protein
MATKPEKLARYKKGWQDAALGRSQAELYTNVADRELMDAYQRGWNEAKSARLVCLFDYCERIQHNPLMSTMMAQD